MSLALSPLRVYRPGSSQAHRKLAEGTSGTLIPMAFPSTTRRIALSTGLAITLAAIVLLTLLGHNRLTDWDEGIYAGISRAMVGPSWAVPDWSARPWVPYWNGQPWLEKPPLMLWITAGFFRLFGVSEFTARLGSALSGITLIGLLHAWLTLRRNALSAWLSTVMLLSTFGFLHVARVGEMDILLSLGCAMSLVGLSEVQRGTAPAWWLFWIGAAVAVMTKGAASITLAITFVLALALIGELRRALRSRSFWMGGLLFLALVLPWHLAMVHWLGHTFLQQYFGLHVLTRATNQIEGHVTPWWFYLRVLLVSAAPWVLLSPCALAATFRRAALRPARVFAIFSGVVLVVFSIAQTRLPHYIAPVYPALSVVTAMWLESWLRPRLAASTNRRIFALKAVGTALAAFGLAALLTAAPRRALHSPRLPNGEITPDNREEIALVKHALPTPSAQTPRAERTLLFLRAGSYNPTPALVFYTGRYVRQVVLDDVPLATRRDIYTNDPSPLGVELQDQQPHLLLAGRSLVNQLPPEVLFEPIASGPTMVLGRVRLR